MIAAFVASALAVISLSTAVNSAVIPSNFDIGTRGAVTSLTIDPTTRAVLNEYGLREAERAEYVSLAGKLLDVEVFRFSDSDGAYGAYLFLLPKGAVRAALGTTASRSEWLGDTRSAVLGGLTVVGFKNYVIRFRRSTPHWRTLETMLHSLPALDERNARSLSRCDFTCDASSERMLLGPISLAKFAPRIPIQAAGFESGGRGRVIRYEMASGPVLKVVFDYPSPEIAKRASDGFRAIRGSFVRAEGSHVAVILDAATQAEAEELATGLGEPETMNFDLAYEDSVTLDSAIAMVFHGSALGGILALLRRWWRRNEGIGESALSLHLSTR
ncbi:MAG: hypothetical protein J0H49_00285 [Acidobacteria bacterium]|nr:hypothetical protein [Acidobacteriota bacterium]